VCRSENKEKRFIQVTVVLVRQNMEILFGNETKAIEGVPQEVEDPAEEHSTKKVMPWQKPMKKQSSKKKVVKKRETQTKATTQLVKREDDGQEDNNEAPDDDEASDNESSSKASDEDSGDEDQEISKLANEFQNQRRKALEPKSRISHPVHCPYFPLEKQEYWWLYVYEKTRRRIQSQPQFLTHLVDREELSLKLAAPSKPGIYTFCLALRSDSYVGFDQVKEFKVIFTLIQLFKCS
jgi:translocation protein SEC63